MCSKAQEEEKGRTLEEGRRRLREILGLPCRPAAEGTHHYSNAIVAYGDHVSCAEAKLFPIAATTHTASAHPAESRERKVKVESDNDGRATGEAMIRVSFLKECENKKQREQEAKKEVRHAVMPSCLIGWRVFCKKLKQQKSRAACLHADQL